MSSGANGKLVFAFANCRRCREPHRHLELHNKGLRSYWRCGACQSFFRVHNMLLLSLLWGGGFGAAGGVLLLAIGWSVDYELDIAITMICAGILLAPFMIFAWPRAVKMFLSYEYVGRDAL
jgi:hypothetical protein